MGKVNHWGYIRSKLKTQFFEKGITYCEMCGRHDYLSFAHRDKRRFITDDDELQKVAILCISNPDGIGCHNKLEYGPRQVMYDTITKIIEARESNKVLTT